ncbi:HAEPLYID family protein [Phaeodactylibacter luteus]|uniref:Phosphoribosylformylglycinamidine synthase n=1 Tax=Phaeodactylibacter luteus TaxID=1564516 RepID=A0A5C6S1F3_9BACT|nr:HAEPLYID family protein [Phaeodactylibacter luteus]TXB68371.1 phosphoribosylformylglycinamidine synthase [Phaeodactylibacter luteus]
MNIKNLLMLIAISASGTYAFGQTTAAEKDSLYIQQVEDRQEPGKVLHAEPLYIDLIRDLGARKGEKEWNIGLGLTDNLNFDAYEALIEYEWAPVDRLGLEVELPFTFYSPIGGATGDAVPSNRLNSLKLAAQWTFWVHEPAATSVAFGYINELELSGFDEAGAALITGNVYNPFFVAAKRWGNNFHTLVYTGPMLEQHFATRAWHLSYDVNTSFHYMISGTRNFVGMELNKTFDGRDFDMTIRPQMRLGIAAHLMVGIVAGIPVSRENERLSSFVRLIWEPGHKGS